MNQMRAAISAESSASGLAMPAMRQPRRWAWWLMGAALGVGLVLRLIGFGASLWIDELGTLWVVGGSASDVLHRSIGQTPLYYGIVWVLVHTVGESEVVLRIVSLVSVAAAALIIYRTGRWLNGPTAGAWAAALFWLCHPAIFESANARPYAIGLLGASVMTLGWVRVCLTGDRAGRILWVAGACFTIWTHYVQAPFVIGLAGSYLLLPALRERYGWSAWLTDAGILALLLLPPLPHFLSIYPQLKTIRWSEGLSQLAIFTTLLPFSFALGLPPEPRQRESRPIHRALLFALLLSVLCQMAALELAAAYDLSALIGRYLRVIIVPIALLSGVNLSRLRGVDLAVPVTVFVLPTTLLLLFTHHIAGSFTQAGFQDWRTAVDALGHAEAAAPGAPVLFRSGFAEDDAVTRGPLPPSQFAPLRSPGHVLPKWTIVPLTYAWHYPGRPAYFEEIVVPRIEAAEVFFLLSPPSREPNAPSYPVALQQWIAIRWPGQFVSENVADVRGLVVRRFDRARPKAQTASVADQDVSREAPAGP